MALLPAAAVALLGSMLEHSAGLLLPWESEACIGYALLETAAFRRACGAQSRSAGLPVTQARLGLPRGATAADNEGLAWRHIKAVPPLHHEPCFHNIGTEALCAGAAARAWAAASCANGSSGPCPFTGCVSSTSSSGWGGVEDGGKRGVRHPQT